jgi:ABC-type uncharacterized transport system auxiliary subunit
MRARGGAASIGACGLAVAALLALSACESPPATRVFSLEVDYGEPAGAKDQRPATLQIQPFTSTDIHSDRRIAWRERERSFEIHLMDNNLWSAAPANMVQEELIACLTAAGLYESVLPSGIDVKVDDVVNGEIRRFEFLAEGEVIVAAALEIHLILTGRRPRRSIWQQTFSYEMPAAGSQAEVAIEAMVDAFEAFCRDSSAAIERALVEGP